MRAPRLHWLLVLAFVSVGSLGAGECSTEDFLMRIGAVVQDHDQRLDRIESCTCCCDGVLAPVCGEDGKTYVNPCEARCADVVPVARGECPSIECAGPEGLRCPSDDLFCELPPGCDSMAVGWCEPVPPVCTDQYDPVCGCNGETYGNDCQRRAAGASLAHTGECDPPPPECKTNDQCADTEFCIKRDGVCSDGGGLCRERPAACPQVLEPVCGCDGRSYPNRCEAAHAGTPVASEGRCQPPPSDCRDNLDCDPDDFCFKRPTPCATGTYCHEDPNDAHCSDAGVCRPQPQACPRIYDPVCGCDGDTYGNECEAAAAGVSAAYKGECERQVVICHIPPGNPSKLHTITVGESAVDAHIANHGDYLGRCLVRPTLQDAANE